MSLNKKNIPTPILDSLKSPADLRQMTREELHKLCIELRSDLVNTISETGGHFASSLGVVELTVALHAVFNTPTDKIVWDVGHQAYIHKILTGRRNDLARVRKQGGISGFPKRDESIFDAFGVGHAGTSISAALGILEASYHQYPGQEDRNVVAVIGDGAMTNGMAFEALNHASHLRRKLIVVLNDNGMSIAPNVGALSWAFSRTITGRHSTAVRKHFKHLAESGVFPNTFYRVLNRAEDGLQRLLSTASMLYHSFGFRYMGPIDGHDINQVMDALERAKAQNSPVLIHAITTKGKGYEPAEQDPVAFHGVTPFEIDSGKILKVKAPSPSYTKVFGQTLVELCKSDPRVVGITAAMPDGTGLEALHKEMPDRFFDVGICEEHAVTFAAGLACEGMRPFCAIYSSFLQRAYDQILHDVCLQKLPVIFAIDRGGLVGADGPTHHGVFDLSYLRHIPNLVVMAPKDEAELKNMMLSALYYDCPVAIRYPRANGLGVDISNPPQLLELGKGEVLRQPAAKTSSALLIGLGNTVQFAQKAAQRLSTEFGIETTVFNARFVKPLDQNSLYELIHSHPVVVTVEDNTLQGGFGSAILEFMADHELCNHSILVRLGLEDKFVEHGTIPDLHALCGIDTNSIVERTLQALASDTSSIDIKALSEI